MQKGGVGKTTNVINLARAAALLGLRVLVVDLDPQGNTTDALALEDLPGDSVSIADAIIPHEPMPLREVIVKTIWPGVDLAPVTSDEALTEAENMIAASKHGREFRLREALEPVLGDYDLVLIDNAPALGLLLVNALAAVDDEDVPEVVLVVMEADRWSTKGLAALRKTIEGVQRYTNCHLRWAGVLISRWRGTRDEKDKLQDIAEHFPDAPVWVEVVQMGDKTIYNDVIPLWNPIKTTINEGKGLDESSDSRLRVLAETYGRFIRRLMEGRGVD
jgi:chromosome partitioning protein